jgi:hypothetical protein
LTGIAERPSAGIGRMGTTAATALPLLSLRITAGPVELRGITDDLLRPLADLVRYEHPLIVSGLAEFRRSIGLDLD